MIRGALLCVCALLLPVLPAAAQDSRAFLAMSVNGVEGSDTLVILRGADALVPVAALEAAGLRRFTGTRETVEGQPFVALASLAPAVTFRIDDVELRLTITANPSLLGVTVRDLHAGEPAGIVYRSASSAFVNYAITAGEDAQYEIFTEGAVRARGGLLYTTASRSARGATRGLTSMTFDERRRLRRWTAGDSFGNTGVLGGDALVGGITLSRDFSLAPYVIRHPTLSVSTPVSTPSTLQVHVNGRLVREEAVQPGSWTCATCR